LNQKIQETTNSAKNSTLLLIIIYCTILTAKYTKKHFRLLQIQDDFGVIAELDGEISFPKVLNSKYLIKIMTFLIKGDGYETNKTLTHVVLIRYSYIAVLDYYVR